MQTIMHGVFLIGLILAFDWSMLLGGFIFSWLLFCIGGSASLHRWCCHRSFEPKNRVIKWFLLWAGVQCTLGSVPGFAASHRHHHVNSETDQDPFKMTDSFWHNFKLFWYHFPKMNISPRLFVDILKDKDMKFSHDHYWKIWSVYPILVLVLGGPVAVVYFVAMPVTYMVLGMSWVTVGAHCGKYDAVTKDHSQDNHLFTALFAGEGLHNSHHAQPGECDFNRTKIDPTGLVIRFLKC